MLRTLIFAGIAAAAGRQLYKSGALDRVGETLKDRADLLKRRIDEHRPSNQATHETSRTGTSAGHFTAMPTHL